MQRCFKQGVVEVGIDEVARGCLAGRIYAGAVQWTYPPDNTGIVSTLIKDSKKLSPKQREKAYDFIVENKIPFGIGWAEPAEIDKINILNANLLAFHRALKSLYDNFKVCPDYLIIDGEHFDIYNREDTKEPVEYTTIVGGDHKFYSIAGASIMAKVSHDRYIDELCVRWPHLILYGFRHNMTYGTATHINAIHKFGITCLHRKTFGICKDQVHRHIFSFGEPITHKPILIISKLPTKSKTNSTKTKKTPAKKKRSKETTEIIHLVETLTLTPEQCAQLIEFMKTLQGTQGLPLSIRNDTTQ